MRLNERYKFLINFNQLIEIHYILDIQNLNDSKLRYRVRIE